MKLDVYNWKEFRLGELFSEMYKAEAHVKADFECFNLYSHNMIKFISRTEMNNGCDCYVINNDLTGIEEGNAISIGDTTATCFYQNDRFICGDHMVICRAKWLNIYTALFILSILKQEKYKYSYGRAFKMELISNTIIKLPATNEGIPDWDFMEQYIKSLNHKPLTTQNRSSQHPLNINCWQEFKVGDYFDVYLSSGDLKIDACEPGKIPLVSSGAKNNGIVGYIDEKGDGKAQIFKANSITVDMFCNAFYQNNDYYAVSHGRVNILYPKFKCNPFIGCFICSIINNERFKYSYGRAVYSDEISRMVIKLPTTLDNVPDWGFMENYIRSLPYGDRI